jgi:hypothetical protein
VKIFTGRRILFIGIGFYDYEKVIVERLQYHGAITFAFVDQPEIVRKGFFAPFFRKTNFLLKYIIRRHEAMILDVCSKTNFDQVLVIKGTNLSLNFLDSLRRQQKSAEFILYQWDSLARLPSINDRKKYFDNVFSFDRKDTLVDANLIFRPLFFRDSEEPKCQKLSIDISFVGWLHADRLALIRRFQRDAENVGLNTFVYLYTGIFTWLTLKLRGDSRDVHFRPLPYKKLTDVISSTRTILDLPHPAQSGLTMRTIEAVGARKKLMTTGVDIVNYDFYSNKAIRVLSTDEFKIDKSFIVDEDVPYSENVRKRYSLDAWLMDIFQYSKQWK